MDEERIEQKLREYFKAEAKEAEPSSEWWDNAVSQVVEQKQCSRSEKPTFWRFRPSLIVVPLSIFLLVILVGGLLGGMGGMAPPPPSAPVTVSDEAGGAFLVWLDRPYHQYIPIIRIQHVDAQGNRLWGEKGQQIASGDVSVIGAVSDGKRGVIVAWRNHDGSYVERLDSNGNIIWTLQDLDNWAVAGMMVPDGSGGVILLLDNHSDGIYAQRVSVDGVCLWGEEVLISVTKNAYRVVSLIGDGLGGAVVVWQEKSGSDMTIRAHRVSVEGKTLWVEGGVVVTSIADGRVYSQQVISDGMGNFFVAWDTGSFTTDSDVYVQKLDGSGNLLWDELGILACKDRVSESNPIANMQSQPQLVADGTGGVIITWHDRRRILNREIFAQRFSSDGEILWTENGVWLWDIPADYPRTAGIEDSAIIADGVGGATIVWNGWNAPMRNSVIYAQKLSPDGQRVWPDEEVYENPAIQSQGHSSIADDGAGGIIIGSRVGEASGIGRTDSVYAQRIDSDGDRMWVKGGLEIEKVRSALTVQFIALGAVLAAMLVLIGVFRRNRIAGICTAILPIFLGIAGLFSVLLVSGLFGYTYGWAYIPDTPLNKAVAFLVPLTALAIGAVGIGRKTVTLWVMVPVMVFCALAASIAGLMFIY
ncbi:hypothetical protein ACFLWY_01355 [Chloroflexota bacterium]